ncbi:sulfite exporter TauE/SafE family protein [Thalassococcus sp. BH17M4-6]|uniref:sulfite exporter TauE/SafE family protein n=1 Tax=Thalassococcus sp. BH17M4-6 TaxID=3413148 RepID=UPI003BC33C15
MLLDLAPTNISLLVAAAFVAACVRGFSGFGSGLIYLPVAAQILTPFQALTTIVIFDLLGPLPILRRGWRDCDRQDLRRLLTGLVVGLPIGLTILTVVAPEVFRYAVSLVALFMVVCLMLGLRYRGTLASPLIYGTGGLSGLLQGVAGIPGPPVILLYMASMRPAVAVRATMLLFLFATDIVLLPMLALFGRLDLSAVLLGALLILPTMAGSLAGAWLFRPEYERAYRGIAYAIITASALSALPIWG